MELDGLMQRWSRSMVPIHRSMNPNKAHTASVPSSDCEEFKATFLPDRVVICSVGELFGGVERHVHGLAIGLREQGTTASLVVFHDAELAAQARHAGIKVTVLPAPNRSTLKTARALAELVRDQGTRVVHAHGYKATVLCAFAQRMHPFALVKTEHGLPEPDAVGFLSASRGHFYAALDLLATRAARAHVCYVTRDLKERRWRAHAGLRTHVIANGVAGIERESCTRPAALCDRAFNLAIVGRLDKVKGHDLAIEALASRVMPENIHLYILGAGPCEHTLRTQASSYGIANRVHFLGFRRDVLDYIAHCDALIMPSLHEGLPYVLLEAMALETPVIASRVGGIAEILEDGITGLLIAPGDSSALVRAILRLSADRSLARRLAENARHLQRARFSLDAMTKRYVAVYREAATPVRGGVQIRHERGAAGQ